MSAGSSARRGEAVLGERFANMVELGDASFRRFAGRPLFGTKRGSEWVWIRYHEVQKLVDDFRGGLATLGVGRGDRVAIVANNRVEWAVAAYATYGLEATFVSMYEAQLPEEWKFILADCGAKVVIGSTERVVAALEAMRPDLPALTHVVGLERPEGEPSAYLELCRRGRERSVASRRPDPQAIAGLIYTSGTTGRPKGVMLSHDNLASNVAAATEVFPIEPDDRTLSFLPWAHVYGQVVELHILVSVGASTAFQRRPRPPGAEPGRGPADDPRRRPADLQPDLPGRDRADGRQARVHPRPVPRWCRAWRPS